MVKKNRGSIGFDVNKLGVSPQKQQQLGVYIDPRAKKRGMDSPRTCIGTFCNRYILHPNKNLTGEQP
jgi:hypothetical protein